MKICIIEGCEKPSITRNWCGMHYRRYQRCGDPMKKSDRLHGMTGSAIYDCWQNIKRNHDIFFEWHSFANFYNDVGDKPTWGHFLQKLDKDKPYGPDNFYWHITEKNRKWNESKQMS